MHNSYVEVIVEISALERERWRFWFYEETFQFYVDRYAHETRASTRHRTWSPVVVDGREQVYLRLGRAGIQLAHPPDVPREVIDDAWQQYCKQIQFGGEYTRR